jgi:monothiol glutaredoxin
MEVGVSESAIPETVETFIRKVLADNDVVLFMKGDPEAPRCGFSASVVQLLNHIGAPYAGVDVLKSDALREGVKRFANWPTYPQLYVQGELVGGADIVREMFQTGELQGLLEGFVPAQD